MITKYTDIGYLNAQLLSWHHLKTGVARTGKLKNMQCPTVQSVLLIFTKMTPPISHALFVSLAVDICSTRSALNHWSTIAMETKIITFVLCAGHLT